MEIKTTREIYVDNEAEFDRVSVISEDPYNDKGYQKYMLDKWVRVDELNKRLNSVMNVRCDEKIMRKLIIDIQIELSNSSTPNKSKLSKTLDYLDEKNYRENINDLKGGT